MAPKAVSKTQLGRDKRKNKPPRPQKTEEERLRAKFRRLHDQLKDGFLEKGVKTCDQLLLLKPEDSVVVQTKARLLISLDRFGETSSLLKTTSQAQSLGLAAAYCLYKQGREAEALEVLDGTDWVVEDERGASTLRAQTLYRLERYAEARDAYEDLLASSDPDHPEHADLQANLNAAQARIDFTASIPSCLSDLASSIPDVSALESTPLAPLVASHAAFKPQGAGKTAALAAPTRKANAREPKPLDPNRPPPDPERWLPKRQRTGYVPPRTKLQVKKDKAKQKLATQGSSGPSASVGGGGKRKGRR